MKTNPASFFQPKRTDLSTRSASRKAPYFQAIIFLTAVLVLAHPVQAEQKMIGYTRGTDSSSALDKMKKWFRNPFSKEKSVSSPYIKQNN